VVKKTQGFF